MTNQLQTLYEFIQQLQVKPGQVPEVFESLLDQDDLIGKLSQAAYQTSLLLQANQRSLQETHNRLNELFHNTSSPLFFIKHQQGSFKIESLNYACEQMFGLHYTHNFNFNELLSNSEQRLIPFCQDCVKKQLAIGREMTWQHGEESRHYLVQLIPIFNHKHEIHLLAGVAQDLTETREYEQRTYRLAYFDEATNLPNRYHLNQTFASLLEEGTAPPVALFLLDIDRFQQINDSLGHEAGDLLLNLYAQRLLQVFTSSHDSIYRLSGDEFVLLHVIQPYSSLDQIAHKILDCFRQPISLSGQDYTFTCSVGVSTCPEHGHDLKTLLKYSDIALFEAKRLGKNRVHFFTHEIHENLIFRESREKALKAALVHNELYLSLQPQIRLKDQVCVGAEALIRWQHPDWGLIAPIDFIPLAEETGLIHSIGRWVIEESCRMCAELVTLGYRMRIAINLSARQFSDPHLIQTVVKSIQNNNLDPSLIEIEITESVLMDDIDHAQLTLNEFKKIGVALSLDDFGTGYSSLAYLRKFPLHALKIDKSFIDDQPITKSIISLAHILDLDVVAEGIETQEQMEFLAKSNCNLGQGFLISKPFRFNEFVEFLKHNKTENL